MGGRLALSVRIALFLFFLMPGRCEDSRASHGMIFLSFREKKGEDLEKSTF